jgi:hypothetical protein
MSDLKRVLRTPRRPLDPRSRLRALGTGLLLSLGWPTLAAAEVPPSLASMLSSELDRNRAQLKLDEHAPPYFISYRLVERDEVEVEARFGALLSDDRQQDRLVAVDVRVGDYTFDSAERPDDMLFLEPLEGFRPSNKMAIDADPLAIRAGLWLLTDRAYKKALSTFLQKKAKKVTTVQDKHVDSFSREKPVKHEDPTAPLVADREAWRTMAREASARMRRPNVLEGTVTIAANHHRSHLVTSEGTVLVKEEVIYQMAFEIVAQAEDGMLLEQGETLYGRSPADLPDGAALNAKVDVALANLEALAKAPVADPYTGPAILEPEATGVFFHETVGHRLEGERQNDDNEGRTFKGQIGRQILPVFDGARRPHLEGGGRREAQRALRPRRAGRASAERHTGARRDFENVFDQPLAGGGRQAQQRPRPRPRHPRSHGPHGQPGGGGQGAGVAGKAQGDVAGRGEEAGQALRPHHPRHHRWLHKHQHLRLPGLQGHAAAGLSRGRQNRRRDPGARRGDGGHAVDRGEQGDGGGR